MRKLLTTCASILGAASVTVSAFMVAEPLGFAVAGGFLIAGSVIQA